MRRKKQIFRFLFLIVILIFIFQNDLFISKKSTIKKKIEEFDQNSYQKLSKIKSYNDYYRRMENLYYNDYNSDQFNIYLKFKKICDSKSIIGQIGQKQTKSYYLIVEYTRIFELEKFCQDQVSDEQSSYIQNEKVKSKLKTEKTSKNQYDLLDKCKYKNCFFSCDKDLAKQSDALLFHYSDLLKQVKNIPGHEQYENIHSKLFDFKRDPSQIWLLWNDEANAIDNRIDSFHFNWTISYLSSSEISFCTYGCLTKSETRMNDTMFEKFVEIEFKKRSNKVLWFVSNCNAKKRMEFVEKMALYYQIEINGKCTEKIKNNFKNISLIDFKNYKCPRDTQCEKNAFGSNKFYFAFENRNCSDYITEKFWRSLDFNLIPIVLHPNKEYYEKIAPENSFIHLADFDYDPIRFNFI